MSKWEILNIVAIVMFMKMFSIHVVSKSYSSLGPWPTFFKLFISFFEGLDLMPWILETQIGLILEKVQ